MITGRENARQDELGAVSKLRNEGRERERERYKVRKGEEGEKRETETETLAYGQSEQDKRPCC